MKISFLCISNVILNHVVITTRSRYHYAIRYVKKNKEIMRKEAMA